MKTKDIRHKNEKSRARAADPADVESIDAIITAAYGGISGPAGKKRDWDRERSLYYPGARLIPTAVPAGGGKLAPQILDIEGFIARVEPFFKETGFYEKEIARRTEQFGNIAHVWSVYECYRACHAEAPGSPKSGEGGSAKAGHNEDNPEPFMRGINSIQLFNDGKRWWIVNIYWQQESEDNRIPDMYLK